MRNLDGVMMGSMISADFNEDTLTFSMSDGYYAQAGRFYIVPAERYRLLLKIEDRYLSSLGKDTEPSDGKW